MHIISVVLLHLHAFHAQVPAPGGGSLPGNVASQFDTILQWASDIGFGVATLGIIGAGGGMAIAIRTGRGQEHLSSLGWAVAGCIVIAAAASIVKVFVP